VVSFNTREVECAALALRTGALIQGTFVLFPVGTLYHGTPKHDCAGKVLQHLARTSEHNQQREMAMHPHA
jgi:hypothetical protein